MWDQNLDIVGKAVIGLQMISKAMGHHGRGMHPCWYLCKEETALVDVTLLEHLITTHHQELHLPTCMHVANLLAVQISYR